MKHAKNQSAHAPTPTAQLQGLARLLSDATIGVARVAEGVHQSVWGSMGVPGGSKAGSTRGLSGLIYASVRGIATLAGRGSEAAIGLLAPWLDARAVDTQSHAAVLAALNGVMGDRLAASQNPLATPMGLFLADQPLSAALLAQQSSTKVLIVVHGLCMNHLQWASDVPGQPSHGDAVALAHGHTVLHLRYNTGLHISDNGAGLSELLNRLVADWPVALERIDVLAHSMGGLVTRSAVHAGGEWQGDAWKAGAWVRLLKRVVFLGTPHHGAPLERSGNWVEAILGTNPYSRPFVALAQLRSAGITDLRHGNLLRSDWENLGNPRGDARTPVPLHPRVRWHAVAGTVSHSDAMPQFVGDGLVPLTSAMGEHAERVEHRLGFAPRRRFTAHGVNHMQLLHDARVRAKVTAWLA